MYGYGRLTALSLTLLRLAAIRLTRTSEKEWQAIGSDTWVIDRKRHTAELIDRPCNEAKTYHWTIENPPFWEKPQKP
jgi:hypothetical protein